MKKRQIHCPGNCPTSPKKNSTNILSRFLAGLKLAAGKVSGFLSTKIILDEFSILLLIWFISFIGIEILLFLQYLSIREVIYQAITLGR